MKFGMRTPSLKRSISARTTGRLNRAVKKAIIPGYGRKGMGILHPRRLYIIKSIEEPLSVSSTWLKLPQVIKEKVPIIADAV